MAIRGLGPWLGPGSGTTWIRRDMDCRGLEFDKLEVQAAFPGLDTVEYYLSE